jgi:hypothetical protein
MAFELLAEAYLDLLEERAKLLEVIRKELLSNTNDEQHAKLTEMKDNLECVPYYRAEIHELKMTRTRLDAQINDLAITNHLRTVENNELKRELQQANESIENHKRDAVEVAAMYDKEVARCQTAEAQLAQIATLVTALKTKATTTAQ